LPSVRPRLSAFRICLHRSQWDIESCLQHRSYTSVPLQTRQSKMAPFSSPSLGVSQDLHQAIKGNEVESISSLGLAEKYEETYAVLHPIFPITSLSIIVGFDTTQRALPSGGILPYFVCIYSSPPTDPTQKILCYKGDPEHFMHLVRLSSCCHITNTVNSRKPRRNSRGDPNILTSAATYRVFACCSSFL
jgi:hypothetical protein